MSKIGLIIKREYSSRVKKKTFLLMTILGPILMVGFLATALWLGQQEDEHLRILIMDDTYVVSDYIKYDTKKQHKYELLTFDRTGEKTYDDAINAFKKDDSLDLLVYLPENIIDTKNSVGIIQYKKPPTANAVTFINNTINEAIEKSTLEQFNIPEDTYARLKSKVNFRTVDTFTNEQNDNEAKAAIGLVFGIMIYMFIFMYGVQVMKGVIEEKSNRIVEVIISSVKPFELMMGKIIGIMFVGLTQFIIWILLSTVLVTVVISSIFPDMMDAANQAQMMQADMQQSIAMDNQFADILLRQINWPLMLSMFLFYFIGGYLLYGSLMAAVGAAVDSETDTQQFMLPVSAPLIFAYIIAISIVGNPHSTVAFWCSEIPFTSPVVMLVRVAMGGEGMLWQIALSMLLLVLTFIGTTWLAGRIYRTGILMYGKKASYKELFKWLKYK